VTLDDSNADESYSVFDHPTVRIFVRENPYPYSPDQLLHKLLAGVKLPSTSSTGHHGGVNLPSANATSHHGGVAARFIAPWGGAKLTFISSSPLAANSLYKEHSMQMVRDTPPGLKPSGF